MTKVSLVRHVHPEIPAWAIIGDEVPLGTEYALLDVAAGMQLEHPNFGMIVVDAYYVWRPDTEPGWLPAFLFETKES